MFEIIYREVRKTGILEQMVYDRSSSTSSRPSISSSSLALRTPAVSWSSSDPLAQMCHSTLPPSLHHHAAIGLTDLLHQPGQQRHCHWAQRPCAYHLYRASLLYPSLHVRSSMEKLAGTNKAQPLTINLNLQPWISSENLPEEKAKGERENLGLAKEKGK